MSQYSNVLANNSGILEQVKVFGYGKDLQNNNIVYSDEPNNAVPQYSDRYSDAANPSLRTFSGSMPVGQLQLLAQGGLSNTIDSELSKLMSSGFETAEQAGKALDKQIVTKHKNTAIAETISGLSLEIVSKTGKLSSRDQNTFTEIKNFIGQYPGLKATMGGIKTKVSLLLSDRKATAPYQAWNLGLDSSRSALMITAGNEDAVFNELNEIYDRERMSKKLVSSKPDAKKYDALSTAMDLMYVDNVTKEIPSSDIKAFFANFDKYVIKQTNYIPKSKPISNGFKEEIKGLLINRVQRYFGSNHTKKEIESAIDFNKMFGILDRAGLSKSL